MRENFLSLNDIRKKPVGFKFYSKTELTLFELLSVEEKWIWFASGFLGDKRQKQIVIKVMDKTGKVYTESNLTNQLNNGNIYTIAYLERDWDKFDFKTVDAIENEQKETYKEYLKKRVDEGKITELEMYKILAGEL